MTTTLERLTPQMVVEGYEKYKASRRGRSSMATSNWPTVLAHACEAYAVYNRTVPPDRRRKINSDLAMIFSEGNDQSRIVKRDLEEAGFLVEFQESQMVWPKYQISGRQDMSLWKEGMKEKVRTEIKSCAPYTYSAVNSVTDLQGSSRDWLVKWWKQVALYMVLQGVDRYWLLLKNKSNGQIKIIEFLMNDEVLNAAEHMIAKAERVNHLIQIGGLPPVESKLRDPEVCSECEFFDACMPEIDFGPGAKVLTDEESAELSSMLERREFLAPSKREYDSLDKDIKEAVKEAAAEGQTAVVIGDWIASIKEKNVKGFTVAARTDRVITFMRAEK